MMRTEQLTVVRRILLYWTFVFHVPGTHILSTFLTSHVITTDRFKPTVPFQPPPEMLQTRFADKEPVIVADPHYLHVNFIQNADWKWQNVWIILQELFKGPRLQESWCWEKIDELTDKDDGISPVSDLIERKGKWAAVRKVEGKFAAACWNVYAFQYCCQCWSISMTLWSVDDELLPVQFSLLEKLPGKISRMAEQTAGQPWRCWRAHRIWSMILTPRRWKLLLFRKSKDGIGNGSKDPRCRQPRTGIYNPS